MIDLTPLDVRKKRGDFRKPLRGYDPVEVDTFLELVADRLEALVKENLTLKERSERMSEQIQDLGGRERAVHEALVTAQELREKIETQAREQAEMVLRDAESKSQLIVREAEGDAALVRREATQEVDQAKRDVARIRSEIDGDIDRAVRDAERLIEENRESLEGMERQRTRFLRGYRAMLERELDVVEVEEAKSAHEEYAIELDLAGGRDRAKNALAVMETAAADEASEEVTEDATESEAGEPIWEETDGLGDAIDTPVAELLEAAVDADELIAADPTPDELESDEPRAEAHDSKSEGSGADDSKTDEQSVAEATADDGDSEPAQDPVVGLNDAEAEAEAQELGEVEGGTFTEGLDAERVEATPVKMNGDRKDDAPSIDDKGTESSDDTEIPESELADADDDEAKTARALESLWLTPLIKDDPGAETEDDSRA